MLRTLQMNEKANPEVGCTGSACASDKAQRHLTGIMSSSIYSHRSESVTQSIKSRAGQAVSTILPHFLKWRQVVKLSERVLDYLYQQRNKERDPWIWDDLSVASGAVRLAAEGCSDPYRVAFCMYFGTQPERALREWAERDRKLQEFLHPKKPAQCVSLLSEARTA